MSFETILRPDLIQEELLEKPQAIKMAVQTHYNTTIQRSLPATKSPRPAKDIIEAMELIRLAILDYQARELKTADAQLEVIYDKPDVNHQVEVISVSLRSREPGMWSQGRPGENDVVNLRPMLREEIEDPDNPGYRRAVLGYFYDNTIQLTCWARTNKAANERALWLENVIEEYTWFLILSGVNRVLYQGRAAEKTEKTENNIWYARPINYFVGTEKLREFSQKKLEEIAIDFIVTEKLYVR